MKHRIMALLLFSIVALLPLASAAVSSKLALDFVTKENHFLDDGESAEIFPSVRIYHSKEPYWVVTILSGDTANGFVAVKDAKEPAVQSNESAMRALFATADVIRTIQKYRDSLSTQGKWFFTLSNSQFFSNLARQLSDETFELTAMKAELDSSAASAEISSMNAKLSAMSQEADSLGTKIAEAIAAENDYFKAPSTEGLSGLKASYFAAFDAAASLDDKANSYAASVNKLKEIISKSSLDVSKKNYLLSRAAPPEDFYGISSKASAALDIRQSMDSAFSSSANTAKNAAENFAVRQKRNLAAKEIFDEDTDFAQKLERVTVSLNKAAEDILLNPTNRQAWKNQERLNTFIENYNNAILAFKRGDYVLAQSLAQKAKSDAAAVYADGWKQEEQQEFDATILVNFAIALIIIFIIIYILRNRNRLFSLVQPEKEEEEFDYVGSKKSRRW